MKILLHLDPLDVNQEMELHRSIAFQKIFNALVNFGYEVKIYGRQIINKTIISCSPDSLILSTLPVYDYDSGAYNAEAQSNFVRNDVLKSALNEYNAINFEPDVIVTNTPSAVIRKRWPKCSILHYELSLFNRPPLPILHQFDPCGYYSKSLLSKFPAFKISTNSIAIDYLESLKLEIINIMSLGSADLGSINAIYFPMPSDSTWAIKQEVGYKNRVQFLSELSSKFASEKIITNEKPQSPLSKLERIEIDKLPNVKIVENEDMNGVGSMLCAFCKATYTVSPSISLQTIFWGNKLLVHPDSSQYLWSLADSKFALLASYVDKFTVREFSDLPGKLDTLLEYNPYKL